MLIAYQIALITEEAPANSVPAAAVIRGGASVNRNNWGVKGTQAVT